MKKSTSKETIPTRKKIQEKEIKEKKIKEKEIKDEKKKNVQKSVEKKVKVPIVKKETSESQETEKKGFTLVELLAVVAILGIVSVIAVGAYNGITTRSKQKAYESKVSQIETSAAKWARENNIDRTTSISVNKLVVEGYLTADEAAENGLSKIINPTDKKNMICNMVNISYKNGEIITSFDANTQNCTLANQAFDDTKIKVVAYTQDTNTQITSNSNNVLPWTNKNLTLVVSSDAYLDQSHEEVTNPVIKVSYDFNGNTTDKEVVVLSKNKSNFYNGNLYLSDASSYYNAINLDTSIIYDGNVIITYHFKDGSTKSKSVNVRIDKEEATASVIANAEWVTATQKVVVKADDGNGSGAKRLYIGTGPAYNSAGVQVIELCSNGRCTSEKEFQVPSVGEYNIWTEDMVGNISAYPKNKITVNNVDTTKPSCTITFEGKEGENGWRIENVTPRVTTSIAGISGLYYGITKGTKEDYTNYVGYSGIGNVSLAKQSETKSQDYTCAVRSLAGLKSTSKANIKVDTTKPLVTSVKVASKNNNYNTNTITLTVKANDQTSGVKKMCVLTSNNVDSCNWEDYKDTTERNTGISYKDGGEITYYVWVKDDAGLISEVKNSNAYKVYQSCSVNSNIINDGLYTCGTNYGTCSDSCGGTQYSTKTQKRKDKYTADSCPSVIEDNSSSCPQKCGGKQQETCGAYSNVGTCSNSCGGTQKITRTCTVKSLDGTKTCSTRVDNSTTSCGGKQAETCNYGEYGTCSNSCGGKQTRTVTCTVKSSDNSKTCSTRSYTEEKACGGEQTQETCTEFGPYGTCSDSCGGTQTRSRTCVVKSLDGTKNCKTRTDSQSQACGGKTESYGTCQVDANAPCSATCGGGVKYGTQTGQYVSTDDGKTCPLYHGTVASKTCVETCNTQSCCSETSYSSCPIQYVCDLTMTYLHMDDEIGGWVPGRTLTMMGGEPLYVLDTDGEYWKVKYVDPIGAKTGTYYIRRFCISEYVPDAKHNCNQICPN